MTAKNFILLFCLPLLAADNVVNMGIFKPSRPIRLAGAGRADFSHFEVRVFASGPYLTNDISVNVTNAFVTTEDLKAVPQGPGTMEVRLVCDDGETSAPSLFRFDLRRFVSAPQAMTIAKPGHAGPPMPILTAIPVRARPKALPGGSNDGYREFMKRIESGKRRGE